MRLLTDDEIKTNLESLPGWKFTKNCLQKNYEFDNFAKNLEVVNKVGVKAEEMNHHPDFFIYSWNKLTVTLSTHNAGGVTLLDIQLAQAIEEITNDPKS